MASRCAFYRHIQLFKKTSTVPCLSAQNLEVNVASSATINTSLAFLLRLELRWFRGNDKS